MLFYILLFLYIAPVCLAAYWLARLAGWIIKKVVQLVIWIVKTFFVLLGRLLFGNTFIDRRDKRGRQPYGSQYDRR